MSSFDFSREFFKYLNNVQTYISSRPMVLGGVTASGGGSGGPPGGFIGRLPQTRITYDQSELAQWTLPASGESLLDNLNRIRYRLQAVEPGSALYNSTIEILNNGVTVITNPTALDFIGMVVNIAGSGVTISGSAGAGTITGAGLYDDLNNPHFYSYVPLWNGTTSLTYSPSFHRYTYENGAMPENNYGEIRVLDTLYTLSGLTVGDGSKMPASEPLQRAGVVNMYYPVTIQPTYGTNSYNRDNYPVGVTESLVMEMVSGETLAESVYNSYVRPQAYLVDAGGNPILTATVGYGTLNEFVGTYFDTVFRNVYVKDVSAFQVWPTLTYFKADNFKGLDIKQPYTSLGEGRYVSNYYGVYIEDLKDTAITTPYGIYITSQTDGYPLYIAGGNTVINGTVKLGDVTGGNYLSIASDGTITLSGDASVWDDERIPVTATKTGGSKDPGFTIFKDDGAGSQGVFAYWFDPSAEEELYFSLQLPHAWKAGTDLYPHVHWTPKTTADGAPANQRVRWGLEYSWAGIGMDFPGTTIIYGSGHLPEDVNVVGGRHYLTPLTTIVGSGITSLSSMLMGRIFRAATATQDTYEHDAGLLEIDFHIQLDSLGSKEEYIK